MRHRSYGRLYLAPKPLIQRPIPVLATSVTVALGAIQALSNAVSDRTADLSVKLRTKNGSAPCTSWVFVL